MCTQMHSMFTVQFFSRKGKLYWKHFIIQQIVSMANMYKKDFGRGQKTLRKQRWDKCCNTCNESLKQTGSRSREQTEGRGGEGIIGHRWNTSGRVNNKWQEKHKGRKEILNDRRVTGNRKQNWGWGKHDDEYRRNMTLPFHSSSSCKFENITYYYH